MRSMLTPEEKAKQILTQWVSNCKMRNTSGKVELRDVSNWAEKRLEISRDCPDLDSVDGVFLFLCLGSLLSSGGGSYQGRVTELRNRYQALLSRRFDVDRMGKPLSEERKERFKAINAKLRDLMGAFGSSHFLQDWWENKKEEYEGDVDRSGIAIIRELHDWTYTDEEVPLFTVKVFWVARELHANGIWSDFPVKYCCIPDGYVKDTLAELYGLEGYKRLFGISYRDPCFYMDSAILMSQKVCELVSTEKVDGYYPYDLPFFRRGYERRSARHSLGAMRE
ncbi:MAG: hypothetical protein QW057_08065 [Candidatus Bathyarchaeia archaeon]